MGDKDNMQLDTRFLARIVIEAETPLSVKSGNFNFYADNLVIRDVNGLPCIPGSTLAGVIRSGWKMMGKDDDNLFGYQKNGNDGMGSRIVISEARILNSKGTVMDGMQTDVWNDELLVHYKELPVRQHVRISEYGTNEKTGLFSEELVYAGTRFCFELEMLGDKTEEETFKELMNVLRDAFFRLGGGTRKGFGLIKVIQIAYAHLPLKSMEYLQKSANLEECKSWYAAYEKIEVDRVENDKERWLVYRLQLKPDDFCLFGSGYGDDEADMTPVKESRVDWSTGTGILKKDCFLMPATSLKGAMAHRVAYHYNRLTKNFVTPEAIKNGVGERNLAVRCLFGAAGKDGERQLRGNVLLSDLFVDKESATEKLLNHIAIDRFSGSHIEGALFTEKAVYMKRVTLKLEIYVDRKKVEQRVKETIGVCNESEQYTSTLVNVINALEYTLKDLCHGLLPLGAGVTNGHGVFCGTCMQEGRTLA